MATTSTSFPEEDSTPLISSSRALAKQKQANSWANRRKSCETAAAAATTNSNDGGGIRGKRNSVTQQQQQQQQQQDSSSIPVCQIVRNAWQQLALDVRQRLALHHGNHHDKQQQQQQQSSSTTTTTPRVFPSVLSVLQASAVSNQVVETFQQHHEDMNVLPADYNWQQAIQSSTLTRERAFLLLDLSAVTRTCVALKAEFGNNVELQYNVEHNRDPKLLELSCRLGIALRTNSKMDVDAAKCALEESQSQTNNTSTNTNLIVDDAGATRKPTGYLRKFLKESTSSCLAVDGSDEVQRIHCTFRRIQVQQGQQGENTNSDRSSLSFILRLPHTCNEWASLVETTNRACIELESCLVGVSVELARNDDAHLQEIREALDSIALVLDNNEKRPLQVDITGTGVTRDIAPFLVELSKSNYRVIVDASRLLVEHAGALCTRIIGVKTVGDTRHVYIDDGCYGSLYRDWANADEQEQQDHTPLPLLNTKSTTTQSTTVWGPTCDGLDRVCKNAILPQMQVDEWLVFPDMGLASGMGTAFNGFDPPDVVYCVLGYFRDL